MERVSRLGVYSGFGSEGADADNLVVPTTGDGAALSLTLNGDRASKLLLPIINPNVAPTASAVTDGFDLSGSPFAFRRPQDPPLKTG